MTRETRCRILLIIVLYMIWLFREAMASQAATSMPVVGPSSILSQSHANSALVLAVRLSFSKEFSDHDQWWWYCILNCPYPSHFFPGVTKQVSSSTTNLRLMCSCNSSFWILTAHIFGLLVDTIVTIPSTITHAVLLHFCVYLWRRNYTLEAIFYLISHLLYFLTLLLKR